MRENKESVSSCQEVKAFQTEFKLHSGGSVRTLTAFCMQNSGAVSFQGCVLEQFLRPFPLPGSRVVLFTVPMSLLASFHSCQGCSHVSTVGTRRAGKCVKRNLAGGKTCFLKLSPYCRGWVTTERELSQSGFLVSRSGCFYPLIASVIAVLHPYIQIYWARYWPWCWTQFLGASRSGVKD